jgi:hypothetical protein
MWYPTQVKQRDIAGSGPSFATVCGAGGGGLEMFDRGNGLLRCSPRRPDLRPQPAPAVRWRYLGSKGINSFGIAERGNELRWGFRGERSTWIVA